MKTRCKFMIRKKHAKKHLKIWFGKVLGSIWEGFGTLWAALWHLLDAFWRFFGRSKSYLVKALVQDELQEAFWMDFGSLWDGFGRVWGEIWKDLGPFRQVMGSEALLPSPKNNLHLQWYKTNFWQFGICYAKNDRATFKGGGRCSAKRLSISASSKSSIDKTCFFVT